MTVNQIAPLRVTIQGTSPLLVDNPKAPDGSPTDIRSPVEYKLYLDELGRIGIPSYMLMNALIRAGFSCKVGRRKLSRAGKKSFVPGIVELGDEFLAIDQGFDSWTPEELWFRDHVLGRSVHSVTPKFERWQITFFVNINMGAFNGLRQQHVRRLFDEAGDYSIGVGYRPACGRTYGSFRVLTWRWRVREYASKRRVA